MFQSRLKPFDKRQPPKAGRPESVIPARELKQTKDGPVAKVPAFEITAKVPMFWDGLCLEAGKNLVNVERFDALPRKTRQAVKAQIVEGNFTMRGYLDAKAELAKLVEERQVTEKRKAAPATVDPKLQAQADEIEIEDADVEEDKEQPADGADVLG